MDRKLLIELFQDGMEYPPGRHRFWISRCFEITVRPDKVVELDEYEGFSADRNASQATRRRRPRSRRREEMFHVGRSILHLKDGRVLEEEGTGWTEKSAKKT